jgi:hypothetical protein
MPDIIVANETHLTRILAGIEAVKGTAVAPDVRWYGQMVIDKRRALADRPSYNGTHFGDVQVVRGAVEVDGSFSAVASYEQLPQWLRLLVRGGGTGTGDGGSPEAFTYEKRPSGTTNALETATIQYNIEEMPKQAEMLWFTEGTIRADIDDAAAAWMFDARLLARTSDFLNEHNGTATSATATTLVQTGAGWTVNEYQGGVVWTTGGTGAGQVRDVASNTADTLTVATWDVTPDATTTFVVLGFFQSGVSDTQPETIEGPGTSIYLDLATGTIGTTLIDVHAIPISFSVTYRNNTQTKRGLSNATTASTKQGHGLVQVTGQIRVEDETPYFEKLWEDATELKLRFRQSGSIIHDAVRNRATIDVYRAVFDSPTRDSRGSNMTVTWPFKGYLDATEAVPIEFETVNDLAALP